MWCGSGGYCSEGDPNENKASFKHIVRASPWVVSDSSRLFCKCTSARTFPFRKIKCLPWDQPLSAPGRRFTAL